MSTDPTRRGSTAPLSDSGPNSKPNSENSALRQAHERATLIGAVAADALGIGCFAALGRRSHDESGALLGVLFTAWPFLIGAAVGWLLIKAWRAPNSVRSGAVIWACSWAGGMALRLATGSGIAPSFMVVAAIALAVVLIGWRLLARLFSTRP